MDDGYCLLQYLGILLLLSTSSNSLMIIAVAYCGSLYLSIERSSRKEALREIEEMRRERTVEEELAAMRSGGSAKAKKAPAKKGGKRAKAS